ncbi:replication protein P [Kosakonia sp. MUSA4]|uniref:replication protein P n=1 Tax=Kosakonia sp. MUSA4 TaxID=2067958 RepID=UPI001598CED0|nr:replication protein P [Kosakonia sp. MUSA4]QJT80409.1 Replication protein P [Kosakonia sp. MUSA4]
MKNIAESMHDFDRENFRRVAAGLPEIQEEQSQGVKLKALAGLFNGLFRELCAIFPYLSNKPQEDLDEMRRQWLQSFAENGIWTSAQIDAGLRVARQQEKPFVPSPGQFVAWCRAQECVAVGLPDQAELMELFYRYCRTRGSYPDAESFPWPGKIDGKNTSQSSANYWIVTTLYQQMRASGLSDAEVRRKAGEELAAMALRIRRGEEIPEPKKQLPKLGGKPLTQAQQLAKIREIQAKHGFKGRA